MEPPTQTAVTIAPQLSMIPKIRQTVEDLERVRRFISQCLNIDLQKWEKKHPLPAGADKDAVTKWEAERKQLEVDWGTIPGNDKPFLMQPGAEKILFWLQLKPKYFNRESDIGNGHIELVSRVVASHKKTAEEMFEGPECSCTTMETNYRYIWADMQAYPSDEEKNRLQMVGFGRSRKKKIWKGGRIVGEEWVWQQRIDNPNIYNERNKVRQMAQKRALVKCTRNMGALSEIFTQPPDEWDIDPVDTDGSPETDMDYTSGGRKIVTQEGRSPSGKVVTQEAREQEAREAAKRVLDEKLAHGHEPGTARAQQAEAQLAKVQQADQEALKTKEAAQERPIDVVPGMTGALPRLQVETVGPDDFIVRGDIQALFPMIEKYCQWKPDHWWHAELANLQAMQGLQAKLKFQITGSPSQSSGAAKRPGRPAAEGGDTASTKAGASAAGPKLINGTILKSIAGMAGQTPVRDVTILLANKTRPSYRTFDKTLFSPLDAGVGKEAEIIIKASGKYTNLVGLKKIGATEYEEDGRTPHALQQKDREAGGQTLF